MSADPTFDAPQVRPHVPIEVVGDAVQAGLSSRRFVPGSPRSMLRAYLELIRELRDQRRDRTIELRSADIDVLATHLGLSGSEVVERLAELMGATRAQRATMLSLFGAGALVIGLAGSTAAGHASPGTPATVPLHPAGAPVAVVAATPEPPRTTTSTVTSVAPTTTAGPAPVVEEPVVEEPAPVTTQAPAAPAGPIAAEAPPVIDDPSPGAPAPETAPATTEPPVYDIGEPPIPPTTTEPPVYDIGEPPIPPTTTEAPVYDIGEPPIPPTTEPVVGG